MWTPAEPGLEAPLHTLEELGADWGCEGSRDMDTERQRVLLFQQLMVLPHGQNLNCTRPTMHSLSWGLFMGQINCPALDGKVVCTPPQIRCITSPSGKKYGAGHKRNSNSNIWILFGSGHGADNHSDREREGGTEKPDAWVLFSAFMQRDFISGC